MSARTPSPEGSPEVDFGAFRRPVSRAGQRPPPAPSLVRPAGATSAAASAYFPTAGGVLKSEQQNGDGASLSQRKMRQGAPRLGGLGLGGIHAPSSGPTKRKAQPVVLEPIKQQAQNVAHLQQPRAVPSPPDLPPKKPASISVFEDGVIGRPFLSPEMSKPTVREGTFVLDRPAPAPVVVQPSQDLTPPDSPTPESSPTMFFNQTNSNVSPLQSPSIARTLDKDDGALEPDTSTEMDGSRGGMFAAIQQVLVGKPQKEQAPAESLPDEPISTEHVEEDDDAAMNDNSDDSGFLTPEDDEDTESRTPEQVTPPPQLDLPSTPPATFDAEPSNGQPEIQAKAETTPVIEPENAPESDSEGSTYDDGPPAALAARAAILARHGASPTSSAVEDEAVIFRGSASYEDDEEAARTEKAQLEQDNKPLPSPPASSSSLNLLDVDAQPTPQPEVDNTELETAEPSQETEPVLAAEAIMPARSEPSTGHASTFEPAPTPVRTRATSMTRSNSSRSIRSTNSTSRYLGVPPPRPSRTKRPPSQIGTSPVIAQNELPMMIPASPEPSAPIAVPSSNHALERSSVEAPTQDFSTPEPSALNAQTDPIVSNKDSEIKPVVAREGPSRANTEVAHPTAPAVETSPIATTGYEGLGLRLPSSLRPRKSRGASQPQIQPQVAKQPEAEPSPPLLQESGAHQSAIDTSAQPASLVQQTSSRTHEVSPVQPAGKESTTKPTVDVAASLPAESILAARQLEPDVPAVVTPRGDSSSVDESSIDGSSVLESDPSEDTASEAESTAAANYAGDVTPPATPDASADSHVADIGVAAVGAIVSGGMAVGYTAWRGLSAAASLGWNGWGARSAPAPTPDQTVAQKDRTDEVEADEEEDEDDARTVKDDDAATESERDVKLPGAFADVTSDNDSDEGEFEESVQDQDGAEEGSEVIETEWGEIAFPAPKGFLEAFKEAMAELGPEDVAADAQMELEAQQAAYASAQLLHSETNSPPSSPELPSRQLPFPSKPVKSKRNSAQSLSPHDGKKAARRKAKKAGAIPEEDEDQSDEDPDNYDELMNLMSPMLETHRPDKVPSYRYTPPPGLSPQLGRNGIDKPPLARKVSSSTTSVASSRLSPSVSSQLRSNLQPEKSKSRSIFGFKKSSSSTRRGSTDSSTSSPPASIVSSRRPLSIDSRTSVESEGSPKSTRRSLLFGGGSSSSSSKTSSMPSIESTIVDTTYVSYSSGRAARRKSASVSSSSDATSPLSLDPRQLPSVHGVTRGRRSSLRKESRYDRKPTPEDEPESKKIYTVRFANATKGIGLRSVAEDEAERAGGEQHAMRWVGVGGREDRYGNLVIRSDAETDQMYADQVGQIKRSWRFGRQGASKDWTTVRID